MIRNFPTPRVVVSKCLEFGPVRYNGETIPDKVVQRLDDFVEFLPVCPEVEIGLGIPRDVIRLVEAKDGCQLIQPKTNKNLTKSMVSFSTAYLNKLSEIDGFLLKGRSPTCGISDVKVYGQGENPQVVGKTDGIFAQEVLKSFPGLAIEEEGRLKNFTLREHFLTKLFTLAAFRAQKRTEKLKGLVEFHSQNKYLFMAYHPHIVKEMGRVTANHDSLPVETVYARYEEKLSELMEKPASRPSHINVCEHIFGYFKHDITGDEKRYFLDELRRYHEEKVPLSTVLAILKAWTIRFDKKYLKRQTYFEPYPMELVEISDSGKGRAYS